ncbi:class I SAM-dependent methyltransferase [Methylomonas sp. LL1]|uniref:class I SAM-dependent methyltransferase n=1 Tax=Methylomonas sp. LL1 TaxID=2785785 RepID=UPI0018C4224B|nr:class I SAM-dependent methyltransferase [Methylomonas sp. LL1]QPK65309.1 class I SAM-dependent methyltransferase [Methylomonas sp. LL1]
MLLTILLLVLCIFFTQIFIGLKLRARFQDTDRRFEKIDFSFLKNSTEIKKLKETSSEIQNTLCLSPINFEYPVFFGGWSIDSYLGKFLTQHLLEQRPQVIVELGSGSSSLLIAKCTQKLGYTPEHIVIDHEKRYLELTRLLAKQNGVDSGIEFNECPLGKIDHHDGPWYQGVQNVVGDRKIDLLIIDGPPESTHQLARYPALPVLHEHLSQNCVVILDDANRNDEKAIIKKWMEQFREFELTLIPEGHGLAILNRQSNQA